MKVNKIECCDILKYLIVYKNGQFCVNIWNLSKIGGKHLGLMADC